MTASTKLKIRVFPPFGESFSEVFDQLRSFDSNCQTIKDQNGYLYVGIVSLKQYSEIWNTAEETGGHAEIIQRLEPCHSCGELVPQNSNCWNESCKTKKILAGVH